MKRRTLSQRPNFTKILGVQSSAFFLLIKTGFFLGFSPPKISQNCLELPEISSKLPEIA